MTERLEIRFSPARVAGFGLLLTIAAAAVSVLLARPIVSRAAFEAVRAGAGYRSLVRSLDYEQYRDLIVALLAAVDGWCLWLVAALARRTLMGPVLVLDRQGRGRLVGFFRDVDFQAPSGVMIELTPRGLMFLPPARVMSKTGEVVRQLPLASVHLRFVSTPPRSIREGLLALGYTVDSGF